jgi:catechol 2,3-dioxygenase-like lactoylglutathione lyase family enzyme
VGRGFVSPTPNAADLREKREHSGGAIADCQRATADIAMVEDRVRPRVKITAYDHVGLRVTDRARSLTFYETLGFRLDEEHSTQTALEIVSEAGVRLNLILNGQPTPQRDNVLMDRPQKWPGYTHAAFIVDSLSEVLEWAEKGNIAITEGPVDWGRRITCFLRDPDYNVLEFNELKPDRGIVP